MPKKPTDPSKLVSQMALAEQIMREDEAVLAALASPEADIQLNIARQVMVRRRGALRDLADS